MSRLYRNTRCSTCTEHGHVIRLNARQKNLVSSLRQHLSQFLIKDVSSFLFVKLSPLPGVIWQSARPCFALAGGLSAPGFAQVPWLSILIASSEGGDASSPIDRCPGKAIASGPVLIEVRLCIKAFARDRVRPALCKIPRSASSGEYRWRGTKPCNWCTSSPQHVRFLFNPNAWRWFSMRFVCVANRRWKSCIISYEATFCRELCMVFHGKWRCIETPVMIMDSNQNLVLIFWLLQLRNVVEYL